MFNFSFTPSDIFWLLPAVIAILLLYMLISDIYTWYYLPRGPLPIPFIGNALQLPKERPWVQLSKWAEAHGPIYTIWIARNPMLVISSAGIANELIEKKGSLYASRPRSVVYGELFDEMSSIISIPYGPAWTIRRRILHTAFKPAALTDYFPRQEAEASRLADTIATTPEQWSSSISRFVASTVFSVCYGRRIDGLDAEVVKKRLDFMHFAASLLVPGAFIAEIFPFLIHFPSFLIPWKARIVKKGKDEAAFNKSLTDAVIQNGDKAVGSITETMLLMKATNAKGMDLLSERGFSALPGGMFNAGVETSASTLHAAILALLLHSHVFLTAQKEVDTVVGSTRSPTFSDRATLPYLEALLKEALRWNPVVPLGITHATTKPDIYSNYRIPAGTRVIINSSAINTEPIYFPFPDSFVPERYLCSSDPRFRSELAGETFPNKWGQSGFGWGRRACVGADLAMNSIWIMLAKLVWGFELRGVDGEKYESLQWKGALLQRPEEFRCYFKVRSEEHRKVSESELEGAEKSLEEFRAFD